MNIPSKLRKSFLEMASPLLEEYVNASLGKGTLSSKDGTARAEVWDLLRDIIVQADDTQKIRTSTTADIIKLLKRGKISIKEAKELMSILKDEYEITQAPELMAKLEELVNKDKPDFN